MPWLQRTIPLSARARGSYLITREIESALPEIKNYQIGVLHLFMQHTSAGLSMNENWDGDVRLDMSDALDRLVPKEKGSGAGAGGVRYRHNAEGADDMPAHVKASLVGASVSIPISRGELLTGTWQGVWYLEFRDRVHQRNVVATLQGEVEGKD